jgi:FMN phosphatase YigB (HAD superfamily)
MEVLGISNYIDVLVSSEEAGIEKPHPSIFLLAIHKL